jgi:hypothetical protein
MTVRAQFRFIVKQSADGTPWIAFEPLHGQMHGEALPSGLFGFDPPPGTTGKDAERIADFLDTHVAALNFTQMPLA